MDSQQKFNEFIENLNIPQLNDEEQSFLEKDLTIDELREALTSFTDNKSPGEDGFTKEFYQTFFDLLCNDLLNSYNEAFRKGSLSVSQKRGTITLIPKGDENLTELKNWRPISLLSILTIKSYPRYWRGEWKKSYQNWFTLIKQVLLMGDI